MCICIRRQIQMLRVVAVVVVVDGVVDGAGGGGEKENENNGAKTRCLIMTSERGSYPPFENAYLCADYTIIKCGGPHVSFHWTGGNERNLLARLRASLSANNPFPRLDYYSRVRIFATIPRWEWFIAPFLQILCRV
jgi:hypothetical protein